jgi:hypothetical protein
LRQLRVVSGPHLGELHALQRQLGEHVLDVGIVEIAADVGAKVGHSGGAHVGEQRVEGAEIIGYDPRRGCYSSQYFGRDGPTSYTATMEQVDGSWV